MENFPIFFAPALLMLKGDMVYTGQVSECWKTEPADADHI